MGEPYKNWYRPKSDTRNPCAVCGWSEHMAIHQPAANGPRKGEYCGHKYQPAQVQPREGQPNA